MTDYIACPKCGARMEFYAHGRGHCIERECIFSDVYLSPEDWKHIRYEKPAHASVRPDACDQLRAERYSLLTQRNDLIDKNGELYKDFHEERDKRIEAEKEVERMRKWIKRAIGHTAFGRLYDDGKEILYGSPTKRKDGQAWCPHFGGLGPPFPFCEECAAKHREGAK